MKAVFGAAKSAAKSASGTAMSVAGMAANAVTTTASMASGSTIASTYYAVIKAPHHPWEETPRVVLMSNGWHHLYSFSVNADSLEAASHHYAHGLQVTLFENNLTGYDKIIGQLLVPPKRLLMDEPDRGGGGFEPDLTELVCSTIEKSFPVNTDTELRIVLVKADNLAPPAEVTSLNSKICM